MRLYHGEHKTRSVTDAEPHNSSVPHNSSGGKGPRAGLLGALCVLLDLGLGPKLYQSVSKCANHRASGSSATALCAHTVTE